MPVFVVVLDACVLFPAALRDTLLDAASAGLYRFHWSDDILEELRRSLVGRKRTAEDKARHLIAEIERTFSDARVTGYEQLIPAMTNDAGDRHVAAAAVAAGAQVIVTSNLRHFPDSALAPFNIEAQSPDEFLINLFDLDPRLMARLVVEQAARLRSPPMTVAQVLTYLERQAPTFAGLVRQEVSEP